MRECWQVLLLLLLSTDPAPQFASGLNPWEQTCVEALDLATFIIPEWEHKSNTENILKQDLRSWWILLCGKHTLSGWVWLGHLQVEDAQEEPVCCKSGLRSPGRFMAKQEWTQLSHLPGSTLRLVHPLFISPTTLLSFRRLFTIISTD